MAAFRGIYIQHSGEEKANGEEEGGVDRSRAETETVSTALWYLVRKYFLLSGGILTIL